MKRRATTFQIIPQIREHLKKQNPPRSNPRRLHLHYRSDNRPSTANPTAPTPTTDSTTVPPEQTPAITTDLAHNLHVVSSEHRSRPISLARDVLQRLERLERREQQRVLSLLLVSQWSSQNIFDFLVYLQNVDLLRLSTVQQNRLQEGGGWLKMLWTYFNFAVI